MLTYVLAMIQEFFLKCFLSKNVVSSKSSKTDNGLVFKLHDRYSLDRYKTHSDFLDNIHTFWRMLCLPYRFSAMGDPIPRSAKAQLALVI